jgi:hypothetical protein
MQVFNFVGSRILTGPMCSDLWVKERQVKERRGGFPWRHRCTMWHVSDAAVVVDALHNQSWTRNIHGGLSMTGLTEYF